MIYFAHKLCSLSFLRLNGLLPMCLLYYGCHLEKEAFLHSFLRFHQIVDRMWGIDAPPTRE